LQGCIFSTSIFVHPQLCDCQGKLKKSLLKKQLEGERERKKVNKNGTEMKRAKMLIASKELK